MSNELLLADLERERFHYRRMVEENDLLRAEIKAITESREHWKQKAEEIRREFTNYKRKNGVKPNP